MNIRDIIDKNAKERSSAKQDIEALIRAHALKGPEGYGVIFEGFTMARWKPWEGLFKDKMGFGMAEDRMYMIRQFAEVAPPGMAAECGVYTGFVTKMLAEMQFSSVLAFDTFEGIKGSIKDEFFSDGDMDISVDSNYDEVMNRLNHPKIEVVKGEVPETLYKYEDSKFAFVHLDMDVFKPTYEALTFFIPRMQPGGFIVLDDYGNWVTPGIKLAVDGFNVKFIYLPTGQGVILT